MFRLSRRKFIKLGIFGSAAGIGLVKKARAFYQDKRAVSRTSLKRLRAIHTTCEQCPAGCGIIAYLNGDQLIQILGNPDHPNNQGGICAKGLAGINLANDPERLLYPMKRIGERGGDRWARITWDEAYTTFVSRIKGMIEKGRINELVIDKGRDDPLLERFIAALGSTNIIDRTALNNLNRNTAILSMIGFSSLIEDVGGSRTILNFGANPYANHDRFIGMARRLVSARVENGAKLVTFDVRMSETAAKSDTWYPIKAGTDGLVALAMAKVIIEKGLANKEFIERNTNYPLLMLKYHLSQYTPEMAERESGVKAADIEMMAVEFATRKPSVAIIGGGISEHENGTQNVRCISLLNWLVGNLEKEGGLYFPRIPEFHKSRYPRLNLHNNVKGIMDLQDSKYKIDTYFTYLSNPAYEEPDCESNKRLLKDEKTVPFLVVMDTHLTETAMHADMVLPAATYLEGWGLKTRTSQDMFPIYNIRQPVVSLLSDAKVLRSPIFDVGKIIGPTFQPAGEAKEIGNVCLQLARRMGGRVSRELHYKDTMDYITQEIHKIWALRERGGLKILKKKGLMIDKSLKREADRYLSSGGIPTGGRKVEIYSRSLMQEGLPPLPEYKPISFHKEKKEADFILTTFKSNLTTRGAVNSKWAREILHENRLWINKGVAEGLGINNGDRVRVTSNVGTLITRVLTTNMIHPKSVAMAEGLGHTAVGNVAGARRFKSRDQDTELVWWGKNGNGVNPNEIIPRITDPIGGGYGLKDTVVRVEKI